jgi:hypothetical protein
LFFEIVENSNESKDIVYLLKIGLIRCK